MAGHLLRAEHVDPRICLSDEHRIRSAFGGRRHNTRDRVADRELPVDQDGHSRPGGVFALRMMRCSGSRVTVCKTKGLRGSVTGLAAGVWANL